MRTLKLIIVEEEPAVSMEWELNTEIEGFTETLGKTVEVMQRAFDEELKAYKA
jgi:hypothetical protein